MADTSNSTGMSIEYPYYMTFDAAAKYVGVGKAAAKEQGITINLSKEIAYLMKPPRNERFSSVVRISVTSCPIHHMCLSIFLSVSS